MAVSVQLYQYYIVDIDGKAYRGGSISSPVTVSAAGQKLDNVYSVATNTVQKIFDVDEGPLSDFDFLWIETDFDVMLELVTDDDADVGEEIYTVPLKGSQTANSYGAPLVLIGDDSYAGYTVNFAAGTLDVIETLRVKNLDNTNTASVHIFAVT